MSDQQQMRISTPVESGEGAVLAPAVSKRTGRPPLDVSEKQSATFYPPRGDLAVLSESAVKSGF